MPSKNTIFNALQYMASSLFPYIPLANCHMVDVLVYDTWQKFLPQPLWQDLDKISVDALRQMLGPMGKSWEILEGIKETCPSLHEFLSLIHSLHLSCLGVLSSKQEVYSHLKLCPEAPAGDLGRLMKEKKMHEVIIMAQVVATLCRELGVSWVCDLGAGKGYLSALLARHYRLNVLAVDSSPGNVRAASTYSVTLQRELNRQRKNNVHQAGHAGQEHQPQPLNRHQGYIGSKIDEEHCTVAHECDVKARVQKQTATDATAESSGNLRSMCCQKDCAEGLCDVRQKIRDKSCCKINLEDLCEVPKGSPSISDKWTCLNTSQELKKNVQPNSHCCDSVKEHSYSTADSGIIQACEPGLQNSLHFSSNSFGSLGGTQGSDHNLFQQLKAGEAAQYLCVAKTVDSTFSILDTLREAVCLKDLADLEEKESKLSVRKQRKFDVSEESLSFLSRNQDDSGKRRLPKNKLEKKVPNCMNAQNVIDGNPSTVEKIKMLGELPRELKISSQMKEESSCLGVEAPAPCNRNIVRKCSRVSSNDKDKFPLDQSMKFPCQSISFGGKKSMDASENKSMDSKIKESICGRKCKAQAARESPASSVSDPLDLCGESLGGSRCEPFHENNKEPSGTEACTRNSSNPPNFKMYEPYLKINREPIESLESHVKNNGESLDSRMSGQACSEEHALARTTALPVRGACVCTLHGCGDLAVHALRVYLADAEALVSCTVGCCYHLVTEAEGGDIDRVSNTFPTPSKFPPNPPNCSPGFPLSPLLQGYRLGRNARMAASQPLPRRMRDGLQDSETKSHYWRALLQLVIVRQLHRAHHGSDSSTHALNTPGLYDYTSFVSSLPAEQRSALSTYRVGRGLAGDCEKFSEYVERAFARLPDVLRTRVKLQEEDLAAAEEDLRPQQRRLQKLCLLRGALGAVVEGIILLDRLAFLLQQDRCQAAFLLPLFDPLQSPRCHAIVAIK